MKYIMISLPFVLTLLAACGQGPSTTASSEPTTATDEVSQQSYGDAHLGAPQRKSGWWEFTSGTKTGSQNLCVTDKTESVFSAFDQITQESLLGYTCSKKDFHRTGDSWAFDIACDTGIPANLGGGVMTSKGTIEGNISTAYEIQMTVTQAGETRNGTVTAAWKGGCPTGRTAGDLVIDSTDVLNVLE